MEIQTQGRKQKLISVTTVLRMMENYSEEAVMEASIPYAFHQRKETAKIC